MSDVTTDEVPKEMKRLVVKSPGMFCNCVQFGSIPSFNII